MADRPTQRPIILAPDGRPASEWVKEAVDRAKRKPQIVVSELPAEEAEYRRMRPLRTPEKVTVEPEKDDDGGGATPEPGGGGSTPVPTPPKKKGHSKGRPRLPVPPHKKRPQDQDR